MKKMALPAGAGLWTLRHMLAAMLLLLTAAVPAEARGGVILIPIFGGDGQPTLPTEITADYGRGHTVAVISLLGDHLTLRNSHFMGGSSRQIAISDWNLDADITASLKHYLTGRFTFKDVPYDRAALVAIPNGPWDNSDKLTNAVKAIPTDGVESFLIVRPDLVRGAPGVEGLGLENGGSAPVIWANYEIDLVDAHTGDLIAMGYSRAKLRDGHVAFSGMTAPDTLRLDDNADLTPDQMLVLHRTINSLVSVSLVETLRALHMGDDLPPVGARTMISIPADHNPYKEYKRVAVVSALGDTLSLHHIGGTIFSQSDYQVSEADWHLDDMVESRAKAALAKNSDLQIVATDVDRAALANAMIWNDDGKLAPSFPGLKPDSGTDLYVVFVKRKVPAYASNMADLKGFGVFDRRPVTAEPDVTAAFAHFGIAIIDAHTMKVIAAAPGVVAPAKAHLMNATPYPDLYLFSAMTEAEPFEEVGTNNWPANPPQMTPDQAAAIHDKLLDVINNSVDETLLRLGILGVVPVEGAPLGAPPLVEAHRNTIWGASPWGQ